MMLKNQKETTCKTNSESCIKIKRGYILTILITLGILLSLSVGDVFAGSSTGNGANTEPNRDAVLSSLASGQELYESGNWYTAQEAFQDAYNQAADGSPLKAQAAFELAGVLWEQGDYNAAYKRVIEAITLAEKANMQNAKGQLLLRKGHIEAARGYLSKALDSFKNCTSVANKTGEYEAAALCRIGYYSVKRLQGKKADDSVYQKDLELLKATKKPVLVGVALAKIGSLQENAGQHMAALGLFEQAQAQFNKSGLIPAMKSNELKIAEIHQKIGRWNTAADILKEMDITFKNMNNRPALVTTYLLYSRQQEHNGDAVGAYNDLKTALRYAASTASPQLQAQVHLATCEFFSRTEDPTKGIQNCEMAYSVFRNTRMSAHAARALAGQSMLYHSANKYKDAEKSYRKAIAEIEKLPDYPNKEQDLIFQKANLCQVSARGESTQTMADCKHALEAVDKLKQKNSVMKQVLVRVLLPLGIEEQKRNMNEEAITHLKRLISLENEENKIDVINAQLVLSEIFAKTDKKGQIDILKQAESLVKKMPNANNLATQEGELNLSVNTAIAQAYLNQELWNEAVIAFKNLIAISKKLGDPRRGAWGHLGLAKSYQSISEDTLSKKALKEGYELAKKANDQELINSFKGYLE